MLSCVVVWFCELWRKAKLKKRSECSKRMSHKSEIISWALWPIKFQTYVSRIERNWNITKAWKWRHWGLWTILSWQKQDFKYEFFNYIFAVMPSIMNFHRSQILEMAVTSGLIVWFTIWCITKPITFSLQWLFSYWYFSLNLTKCLLASS